MCGGDMFLHRHQVPPHKLTERALLVRGSHVNAQIFAHKRAEPAFLVAAHLNVVLQLLVIAAAKITVGTFLDVMIRTDVGAERPHGGSFEGAVGALVLQSLILLRLFSSRCSGIVAAS